MLHGSLKVEKMVDRCSEKLSPPGRVAADSFSAAPFDHVRRQIRRVSSLLSPAVQWCATPLSPARAAKPDRAAGHSGTVSNSGVTIRSYDGAKSAIAIISAALATSSVCSISATSSAGALLVLMVTVALII